MFWKRKNQNKTLHNKRGASQHNGVGTPYHQAYGYRSLPSAGANQWAWLTELLPTYPPAGLGVPNGGADPALNDQVINAGQINHSPSGPVFNMIQGAVLYVLGDPGMPSGQYVLQPLTDTSPAPAVYSPDNPVFNEGTMVAG